MGLGAAMASHFAGSCLGGVVIGGWVDGRFDSEPWGLLTGSLLGLTGGIYGIYLMAIRLRNLGS